MVALRLPVIHGTSCNQLVTEIRHLAVSLNWDITKLYQTIGLLMKKTTKFYKKQLVSSIPRKTQFLPFISDSIIYMYINFQYLIVYY